MQGNIANSIDVPLCQTVEAKWGILFTQLPVSSNVQTQFTYKMTALIVFKMIATSKFATGNENTDSNSSLKYSSKVTKWLRSLGLEKLLYFEILQFTFSQKHVLRLQKLNLLFLLIHVNCHNKVSRGLKWSCRKLPNRTAEDCLNKSCCSHFYSLFYTLQLTTVI